MMSMEDFIAKTEASRTGELLALVWEAATDEQREEFCKVKRAELAEYVSGEE